MGKFCELRFESRTTWGKSQDTVMYTFSKYIKLHKVPMIK